MAVKIRLKQTGKINARHYRLVAVDESKKRDGRVIEELGSITDKGEIKNLNKERIEYWTKVGAKPTTGALKFLQNK